MTELTNPAEVFITPEYYADLQDQFSIYWMESGMSTELDADYEEAEYQFISRELNSDNWEVMGENNLLSRVNQTTLLKSLPF
ncbi:hypothetical protein NVP1188A_86 [Vibrio phage 1.188.A._10N.286.51.A6]|uniref:Uncharacterized protein n=3 Tax=Mukerjeevirus mv51A6 TaxID=2734162 RepID=A0A2I7RJ24_9CAUD|nr:hypothetical protein HOU77_gp20 [Vibrio phage 1.188.A._10N.286.51.A6]AUR93654.1 hypothetical protein NVP1188A_86 [Vibrio phage 1.188.A._10N.286.51.A6]AUR93740.1 hypothetical protein NVP1188B_86 [Vibrio phage 1.188.B._10N.286.51.A6]AUR93826.1 hypothetical protein NVP1188C_86 [Vibrio phage 1.188.C._10N.286.51.A6]